MNEQHPPPVRPPYVAARVVDNENDWDALRPQWDALHAASANASPLDFAWLRTWWRVFGAPSADARLRIVTAWRGTRLIGVLPLYERRCAGGVLGARELRFLSTGEAEYEETCPDYLDLLCLPKEQDACLPAVWNCVGSLAWDHLELLDLSDRSPLVRGVLPPGGRTTRRGTCPVANLAGGFEAYLRRLSPNGRQQARRLLREGEKAGATFDLVNLDHAAEVFEDLVRLHQARWTAEGKPGVFAAPRFTTFHREMIRQWLPCGRAVLARLSVAGEPVAVLYGFVSGSRFEFYQSGVRRDVAGLRSPGNLAHLRLMQMLAQRGITSYDFLRGASSYKARLATDENRLVAVQVWRRTVRAATSRAIPLGARVVRRGVRVLFQRHA